jgi:hypothetical protein
VVLTAAARAHDASFEGGYKFVTAFYDAGQIVLSLLEKFSPFLTLASAAACDSS